MSSQTQSPDTEIVDLEAEAELAAARAKALDVIDALGSKLMRLAQQQVSARQTIEDRWIEDLRQWHGRYDPATEAMLAEDKTRSKVFTNLTRTKTNAAESRLIETVLPIDDRNWALKLTPVSDFDPATAVTGEYRAPWDEEEIEDNEDTYHGVVPEDPEGMPPEGMPPEEMMPPENPGEMMAMPPEAEPLPEGMPQEMGGPMPPEPEVIDPEEEMWELRLKAAKRMRAMQDEIDDQLAESRYNNVCRQVIHSACVLGTGVAKGPVVVGKTRKRWKKIEDEFGDSIHVMVEEEIRKPIVEWIDTWNFFPDMSVTRIDDAEFTFERRFYTKSRVRSLRKRPGFMEEQLRKVLEMGPRATRIDQSYLDRIREVSGLQGGVNDNLFEVWIYEGPVEAEDLVACGCPAEEIDPLDDIKAEVWIIGDVVVKADIALMDTQDVQYSVFNWEEDEGSIFGYGVPWRSRHPQRIANAALRMVMENGGLSARPQTVVNGEVIEPTDNNWQLVGGKTWRVTDRNTPVASAFGLFDVPSHLDELMGIFNLAKNLMDEETAIPATPSPENAGHMSPTLGGMSILMNQANIVLRRVVKAFDDNLTVPLIRRFYDWNMQYSDREDIKGDYDVDARGTSALLQREALSQSLIQMIQYLGTPGFENVFRKDAIAKALARALQLPVEELVNSPEEIKRIEDQQAQNQPQDPQLERAKIAAESMQNKMAVTYQMHQERMAQQNDEFRLRAIEAQKNWESQLMKLMGEQELGAEKIKADLAKVSMNLSAENQRFMKELAAKAAYGPRGNMGLGER